MLNHFLTLTHGYRMETTRPSLLLLNTCTQITYHVSCLCSIRFNRWLSKEFRRIQHNTQPSNDNSCLCNDHACQPKISAHSFLTDCVRANPAQLPRPPIFQRVHSQRKARRIVQHSLVGEEGTRTSATARRLDLSVRNAHVSRQPEFSNA
jgi:hypothetical protein